MLKKLVLHTSHYSLGSLLVTAAGFISFPFLTRMFSVADYGVMNLISATLMILLGIGKLGVQHSIIRYQSEIQAGRRPFGLETFHSTALLGMAGTGLLATLAWLVLSQALPLSWLKDERLPGLFALTSVLIVVQVVDSCLTNVLRAEQRSGLLVGYQVVKKYAGLGLIVLVLLFVARDLRAFYSATIGTEVVGVAVLGFILFGSGVSRTRPSLRSFSLPLFKEMLHFGIPMMIGYELSGIILSVGDRYVIQALLPGEPLGIYSAAYNLCQYVQTVFIYSLSQAIMPIYMRLWDEKGEAETRAFIDQALRYYVRLGLPVIAGMAAVGADLLPFVASEKYQAGSAIVPWVIAGMMVDGVNVIAGAGLFIHRKTKVIMRLVLGCAALNIGLNIVLIPRMGILGAAVATLVSYVALSTSMAIAGSRLLRLGMPWASLATAALGSALMYLAVLPVHAGGRILNLLARVSLGALVYAALLLALDGEVRQAVRAGLRQLRSS